MSLSSQWSLFFWFSHQYPICIPLLAHSCYMPCPSHPPWLYHSNFTWRRVKLWTELLGFWTFSIVWYSREHDVSETGSVSVLSWRCGRRHLLRWAP
jgi:hypothetical protein